MFAQVHDELAVPVRVNAVTSTHHRMFDVVGHLHHDSVSATLLEIHMALEHLATVRTDH
jgi:hypothetical protein